MAYDTEQIKSFIEKWLDPKDYPPCGGGAYAWSSQFYPPSPLMLTPIVFTRSTEFVHILPRSDPNDLQIVVIDQWGPMEEEKMSQYTGKPVYLLVVSRENECAYDCYHRAYKEMLDTPGIFNLQCIIVTGLIDNTKRIATIRSVYKLKMLIEKLQMELDWKIFTSDLPDMPISSRMPPLIKLQGQLWLIKIPKREHSIFFPKILMSYLYKQNRTLNTRPAYQYRSIVHFYQQDTKGYTLEQISQGPSDIWLNYYFSPKIAQTRNLTECFKKNMDKYFCYDIPAYISWSKANILAWLKDRIAQINPDQVIIDINVDLKENSDLQETIQALLSQGIRVWFCSPGKASQFPLPTYCDIEATGAFDDVGNIFFKAKINSSDRFLPLPNQILLTQHKPIVPKGKYAEKIEFIRQMEAMKTPDKIMADKLGVSINTIRQIKKENKIRTNLPLKNKRRQGLNKKVEKLYDKMQKKNYPIVHISPPGSHPNPFWPNEKQIKEIAVKVGRAPSYVRKTLKILLARRHNRPLDSSLHQPTRSCKRLHLPGSNRPLD